MLYIESASIKGSTPKTPKTYLYNNKTFDLKSCFFYIDKDLKGTKVILTIKLFLMLSLSIQPVDML